MESTTANNLQLQTLNQIRQWAYTSGNGTHGTHDNDIIQFKKGSSFELTCSTKNGRFRKFLARIINFFSKKDYFDEKKIGNSKRQKQVADFFHQQLSLAANDPNDSVLNPPNKLTRIYVRNKLNKLDSGKNITTANIVTQGISETQNQDLFACTLSDEIDDTVKSEKMPSQKDNIFIKPSLQHIESPVAHWQHAPVLTDKNFEEIITYHGVDRIENKPNQKKIVEQFAHLFIDDGGVVSKEAVGEYDLLLNALLLAPILSQSLQTELDKIQTNYIKLCLCNNAEEFSKILANCAHGFNQIHYYCIYGTTESGAPASNGAWYVERIASDIALKISVDNPQRLKSLADNIDNNKELQLVLATIPDLKFDLDSNPELCENKDIVNDYATVSNFLSIISAAYQNRDGNENGLGRQILIAADQQTLRDIIKVENVNERLQNTKNFVVLDMKQASTDIDKYIDSRENEDD